MLQEYFISYEVRGGRNGKLLGTAFSTFTAQGAAGDGVVAAISRLKEAAEEAADCVVVVHVVVLTKL